MSATAPMPPQPPPPLSTQSTPLPLRAPVLLPPSDGGARTAEGALAGAAAGATAGRVEDLSAAAAAAAAAAEAAGPRATTAAVPRRGAGRARGDSGEGLHIEVAGLRLDALCTRSASSRGANRREMAQQARKLGPRNRKRPSPVASIP